MAIVERVQKKYKGSKQDLDYCTVSYLCFEPRIGNQVLKEMVWEENNIRVFYGTRLQEIFRTEDRITGIAGLIGRKSFLAFGKIIIDATDLGSRLRERASAR